MVGWGRRVGSSVDDDEKDAEVVFVMKTVAVGLLESPSLGGGGKGYPFGGGLEWCSVEDESSSSVVCVLVEVKKVVWVKDESESARAVTDGDEVVLGGGCDDGGIEDGGGCAGAIDGGGGVENGGGGGGGASSSSSDSDSLSVSSPRKRSVGAGRRSPSDGKKSAGVGNGSETPRDMPCLSSSSDLRRGLTSVRLLKGILKRLVGKGPNLVCLGAI